jgi:hypothetical protein
VALDLAGAVLALAILFAWRRRTGGSPAASSH